MEYEYTTHKTDNRLIKSEKDLSEFFFSEPNFLDRQVYVDSLLRREVLTGPQQGTIRSPTRALFNVEFSSEDDGVWLCYLTECD